MMTEAKVKQEVKKILNKYGVCYFMPSASIYGKSGVADFVCCVNGYYLEIEAKAEDVGLEGLTELQKRHRKDIEYAGGEYCVVYDRVTLQGLSDLLILCDML